MKNNNKLVKRFSALMILFALCGITAMAGNNKLWIEDFEISPNETKTIEILLDNEDPISSLQFDVQFPEGITYVDGQEIEKVTTRITRSSHSITAHPQINDVLRFVVLSNAANMAASAIKGSTGAIFKIQVKASKTFKGGDIFISNLVASNGTQDPVVEVGLPSQTVKISAKVGSVAIAQESVALRPGETTLLDVIFENQIDVVGLEAIITLPQGVKFIEGADGEYVTYTDRLSENTTAIINPLDEAQGKYKLVISSLTNDVFYGNTGVLFSLNIVADENIAAESVVKIEDIVVSSVGATSFDINDTPSVSILGITDITGDNAWDIDDIYAVIDVIMGASENKACDLNKDGAVDIDDLYSAIDKVMGN